MSIIDAGLRGGAIALLLLLTILLLRDGRSMVAGRFGALLALSGAADMVGSAPMLDGVRALWLAPLRLLAAGAPAVFWITVSALFDDDFEPSWIHAAAWICVVGASVWGALATPDWRQLPHLGVALACIAAALWNVAAGRAGDLDEARRRLRLIFVVWVGLFSSATITAGALIHTASGSAVVSEGNAVGNLALGVFFAVALLSMTPGALLRPLALVKPKPAAPSDVLLGAIEDPREAALLAALRRELGENRAYREEALGIAVLAARLGAPEYRLRRLINQRLGHRNFAAFLNGYRLDEAMAALADQAQAEVPILTIALDAGFASIGPFNRAFKTRTGRTPTDYRRTSIGA